jgi:hypothetical protein
MTQEEDPAKAAALTRTRGAVVAIVGTFLLSGAVGVFAFADTPEIRSWVRQTILTLIAIMILGGLGAYISGQSVDRTLNRLDEAISVLREVRRGQTYLLTRPMAEGAASDVLFQTRPPSPDTLNLVRRKRLEDEQRAATDPPSPQPDSQARDLGELMERAEWYNLGAAVERRRHDPDATN